MRETGQSKAYHIEVEQSDAFRMKANSPDRNSSLFVGSVAKAFRILEAFDMGQRALPLVQIAALSELDASAAQRAVYTLMALGYLRKDPSTRHYSLTPKILNLGTSYLRAEGLAGRATPYIRKANEEAGETVSLLELEGTDVIHVIRYGAPGSINMRILMGSRSPAYTQAGGRAILAFMAPEAAAAHIDEIRYEPLTKFTLTSRGELETQLARIKADGYAIVEQEHSIDDVSLAAPILAPNGHAIASVSFQIPPSRWAEPRHQQKLIRIVLDTANAISAQT